MKNKIFSLTGLVVLITIVLILSSAVIIMFGQNKVGENNVTYASNSKELQKLNAEYNVLLNEDSETVEAVRPKLNSAADAGTKVAEYQNKYSTLNAADNEEEYRENATNIGVYLDDKSKQVPWYTLNKDIADYEWKFNSTYSFSGDSVPVLWTCYQKLSNGEDAEYGVLFAYTTGTYNVADNMFHNIKYNVTSVGQEYLNKQYTKSEESE